MRNRAIERGVDKEHQHIEHKCASLFAKAFHRLMFRSSLIDRRVGNIGLPTVSISFKNKIWGI
jgi:hypothetical protein